MSKSIFILIFIFFGNSAFAGQKECLQWKGLNFFKIPSGDFIMGGKGFRDESPQHLQRATSFCIMHDHLSAKNIEEINKLLGTDFYRNGEMTWQEANDLAVLLSKKIGKKIRLPTEMEWEYAVRGGLKKKKFPWGNIGDIFLRKSVSDIVLKSRRECGIDSVEKMINADNNRILKKCIAQHQGCSQSSCPAVKEVSCLIGYLNKRISKVPANSYGLINTTNNAWEWTSSKYMPYPYRSDDGREDAGEEGGKYRVIRGGNNNTETCLSYVSLRGYGSTWSSYNVRFVLEN